MAMDILHTGHLNIINEARKLGEVTIGLLSDEAIIQYKRLPLMDYEKRKEIISNIKGIRHIIKQETFDYEPTLRKLRPNYLVHGDDWKTGVQSNMRLKVIKILKEWNGQLIEPKYTEGISSTSLIDEAKKNGITSDARRKMLRRLLLLKPSLRILEAHNGLTGLIVEKCNIMDKGLKVEFDGIWESSLTDSTIKGKPDTELVDFSSRISTIEEILEVTSKPLIVDGDSGGRTEHFKFKVKTLERLGVSAVIIEDKKGPKVNSLFGTDIKQTQDSIQNFCKKIKVGKKAQITSDFMIIARVESLILKKGIDDALKRAKAYVDAGSDAIMIHSKEKDGSEIIEFCKKFRKSNLSIPLVVVPSTYSHMTERDLNKIGVNIIIYANHLIRSSYPSMLNVAKSILKNNRSKEASEKYCMSIKEIINLIPNN